jgi:hypothetical protein
MSDYFSANLITGKGDIITICATNVTGATTRFDSSWNLLDGSTSVKCHQESSSDILFLRQEPLELQWATNGQTSQLVLYKRIASSIMLVG